jgi:putative ABC transport system permease protein
MGIPLIAGRTFEVADNWDSEPVAVINQSLANALWPGENPVGRRMWPCSMMGDCDSQLISVIGVVEDVHDLGLDVLPPAQLYFSARQGAFGGNMVVRTAGVDPLSLSRQLRDIVAGLDATVPVSSVTTLEQLREDSLAPRRLTLILLTVFAGVALLVSFAGIAGVMAFGVSQRTYEIGIRMALGAGRETVLRAVLGRGVAMIVVGLGLGVVTALVATRVMSGLVWGVSVVVARTFLATGLILAPMALIACYLPARKATRVDPVVAFRSST